MVAILDYVCWRISLWVMGMAVLSITRYHSYAWVECGLYCFFCNAWRYGAGLSCAVLIGGLRLGVG